MEELRSGGTTMARKPVASGLPEAVGGRLPHAKEGSTWFSIAGGSAPPEARSADSVTCVCPATPPAPALGSLSGGFLVLGLDVYGIAKGSGARDPDTQWKLPEICA